MYSESDMADKCRLVAYNTFTKKFEIEKVMAAAFVCNDVTLSCASFRGCNEKSDSVTAVKIQEVFQDLSRFYGAAKEPGKLIIYRDFVCTTSLAISFNII
jgi:hypothetical protein